MKEITLDAYGKLNLTLDILGRRPDGYHDLRMVMQSVSLCDRVTIRETENGQIALRTSAFYLPCDRGNLAYRAAEAFFAAVDVANPGVALYVEKRIPVCAGMAGGSADAAAVLRGLRRMYAPQLSVEELCRIGERVGSDVPYCVFGGTARRDFDAPCADTGMLGCTVQAGFSHFHTGAVRLCGCQKADQSPGYPGHVRELGAGRPERGFAACVQCV